MMKLSRVENTITNGIADANKDLLSVFVVAFVRKGWNSVRNRSKGLKGYNVRLLLLILLPTRQN